MFSSLCSLAQQETLQTNNENQQDEIREDRVWNASDDNLQLWLSEGRVRPDVDPESLRPQSSSRSPHWQRRSPTLGR